MAGRGFPTVWTENEEHPKSNAVREGSPSSTCISTTADLERVSIDPGRLTRSDERSRIDGVDPFAELSFNSEPKFKG